MNFASIHVYAFLLPLVLTISIVYSASRHEPWGRIWAHALHLCTWILGILLATTALLLVINSQV